jgi:hypothetical protein
MADRNLSLVRNDSEKPDRNLSLVRRGAAENNPK